MSGKIIWDQLADRRFEQGVDHGVLYPMVANAYTKGVAWNGLTNVTESPSGAEPEPFYADGIKFLNLMTMAEFGATIEAVTYPDEFLPCDGFAEVVAGVTIGGQSKSPFGFCFRTKIGGANGEELGYKLHIVYGALAGPSEKAYATINETPEPVSFSWEITTTPIEIPGYKPTSHIIFDSTKTDPAKLAALETILYGKDATTEPVSAAVDPRLPLPSEVFTIMAVVGG